MRLLFLHQIVKNRVINKLKYKEDVDLKIICLYETSNVVMSVRIIISDILSYRILHK